MVRFIKVGNVDLKITQITSNLITIMSKKCITHVFPRKSVSLIQKPVSVPCSLSPLCHLTVKKNRN